MEIVEKAALAVFKDKKILMTRHRDEPLVFFSLGGKIEPNESDIECLKREIKEEVDCEIEDGSFKFLKEFDGPFHGDDSKRIRIRLYEGKLIGNPKPSSEIVEIQYFDSSTDPKHMTENLRTIIFPWLKERGYIC